MTAACAAFRLRLEEALAGPGTALGLLEADPHPAACAACRAELERERALEDLLERWPSPGAPAELAERLLAHLAQARPTLAPARDPDALEELLEGLPAPEVPVGLAERVLRGVAHARPARPSRPARILLAAAAGLAGLALWAWSGRSRGEPGPELAPGPELEADADLLAYAVERWELLHDDDLDVWLASLDPVDELLLEYAGDETWPEEAAGSVQPAREEGF